MSRALLALAAGAALALLALLALPALSLLGSLEPGALTAGWASPLFVPAFTLSLQTTAISIAIIVLLGTPLAAWLAGDASPTRSVAHLIVGLPLVVPPAVVGLGLLLAFGRQGPLGQLLASAGLGVSFSPAAVVLAQVTVSAPLYVLTASRALGEVDRELLAVARSLGASRLAAFARVTLPLAAPGLITATALTWARALGEFGATLFFAGNLPGRTQTLTLAIYAAMEGDVQVAVAIALGLAALGTVLLGGLWLLARQLRGGPP